MWALSNESINIGASRTEKHISKEGSNNVETNAELQLAESPPPEVVTDGATAWVVLAASLYNVVSTKCYFFSLILYEIINFSNSNINVVVKYSQYM